MTQQGSEPAANGAAPAQAMPPHFGHLATQAFLTALELEFMGRLAGGPATAQEMAQAAGADLRATTMVLDALVGLGQLEKETNRYRLPTAVQRMLESPGVTPATFFSDTLSHLQRLLEDWSRLPEVVRSGRPVSHVGTASEGEAMFVTLARRLFPANYPSAKALHEAIPAGLRREGLNILDVGAGSAVWSIPFAEDDPSTAVVAVDFEPVLAVARHFTRACGVEDRYTFTAGDIREIDFGRDRFDLALLGHICHSEGPRGTQRLFGKMHGALRPGGAVLVIDMFPDDERTGRGAGPFPLLFALNMLVHTDEGGTFTIPEYRAWGTEAGFKPARVIQAQTRAPVLLLET